MCSYKKNIYIHTANVRLLPVTRDPTMKYKNTPVLHAERVYVQNPNLIVAHDVVHLHIETMSLLLEHVPLCSDVLELIGERLHAVLQHLILQRHKTRPVHYFNYSL